MNEIYKVRWYQNLFVYTSMEISENPNCNVRHFIISQKRNDIAAMLNHLEVVQNQVGFGNDNFDYYILHYLINSRSFLAESSVGTILESIKNVVDLINDGKLPEEIINSRKYMSQLDMEKFWGFKSYGREIDLLDLKISLGISNCTKTQVSYHVPDIYIKYLLDECESDVKTINGLYRIAMGKCKYEKYSNINLISARYKLSEAQKISQTNLTPSGFALKYFFSLYRSHNGEIKDKNSVRLNTSINNSIPDYAQFSSMQFNDLVNKIKIGDESKFSESVIYNGIALKFGLGGVHGCASPGRYNSNGSYIIVDLDIVSMYATIAIALGIKPRHMDSAFTESMKDIVKTRFSCIDSKDSVDRGIVSVTKSILNYIYGKTKEPESPVYDPQYSIDVTIAAQLFMARFLECLKEHIHDINFIMVNTDSITFRIKSEDKTKVFNVFGEMRKIIPFLRIKLRTFDILYVKDINNYLAQCNDEIVAKGVFDYNVDVYKENSKLVIPKAAKAFLIDGMPIVGAIQDCSIYDYCCKAKSKNLLMYGFISEITNSVDKTYIQNPSRFYYTETYKKSGRIIETIPDKPNTFNTISDNAPVTVCNTFTSNMPPVNMVYYRKKISELISEVNLSPNNGLLFNGNF